MESLTVCVDGEQLFAPHETSPAPLIVTVRQGYPFLIPCRPTHPDVVMTLWKGKSNTSSEHIPTGLDISYHPHTGFQVLTPNYFYRGQFHCQAQFTDTLKFHDFLMFFMREFFLVFALGCTLILKVNQISLLVSVLAPKV